MRELPKFSAIDPAKIVPSVKQAISDYKKAIEDVCAKGIYTWNDFIVPLNQADKKFDDVWHPVVHLNGVTNTPELRKAFEECLPAVTEFYNWAGQHEGLFKGYTALHESPEFSKLSKAQQTEINHELRDFKLSGFGLPEDKKKRFNEIESELSQLAAKFGNNLLDSTVGWSKVVTDRSLLEGLPESYLAGAKEKAEAKGLKDSWLLTLDFPSYRQVIMYAENRELRREIYEAYMTRASELGPNAGKWDNGPVMRDILRLSEEQARILGCNNYAELSLIPKMAGSTSEVFSFLRELAARAKPQAEKELADLRKFAAENLGMDKLEPWDMTWASEKQRKALYDIDDEQLRPYFPLERVLSGLFETAHRLYGISVKKHEGSVDVWNSDVRFFDVFGEDGSLIGHFYYDPFAREMKQSGAWMDTCLDLGKAPDGTVLEPVAYLCTNFTKPAKGEEARLTHDDVITIFHEFGHGLNLLLTAVDDAPGVTGINGVAWDTVELPSQFMENWCWEKDALSYISGRTDTGEPLPDDILKRLLDAKNFHSAMATLRQLEFALTDFTLFAEYDPEHGRTVEQIADEVRKEVRVVPSAPFDRFLCSFSHIFNGGYSAGYYSYKWAEVLAEDAYSKFEENGIFDRMTGDLFRKCILSVGGSCDPMEAFVAFRGRKPTIDALLRHTGITDVKK